MRKKECRSRGQGEGAQGGVEGWQQWVVHVTSDALPVYAVAGRPHVGEMAC
jgi:hypothetical protein